MKNLRLNLILVIILFCSVSFGTSAREKYNFNSDWLLKIGDMQGAEKVQIADKSWKKVTLPAAFNEDEAFKLSILEHTDTVVWYRKHFKLPKTAKNQKIFL